MITDLQRINVRIGVAAQSKIDVAKTLGTFARWRTERDGNEWLDLADYAHVPNGPLAMIVGMQGNLVFDLERGEPGLVYRNKKGLSGSEAERIQQAIERALGLAARLVADGGLPEGCELRPEGIAITFNDRVETPNTNEVHERLGPAVSSAMAAVFGTSTGIQREPDAGRLYGVRLVGKLDTSLDDVLQRLQDEGVAG